METSADAVNVYHSVDSCASRVLHSGPLSANVAAVDVHEDGTNHLVECFPPGNHGIFDVCGECITGGIESRSEGLRDRQSPLSLKP